MPSSLVEKFTKALKKLEETRDPAPLLDLFGDSCEVTNVAIHPLHGKEGCAQFWKDYIAGFQEVRTEFTRVTETKERAFLEWTSTGRLQSGRPLTYEGLTVLDLGDEKIDRMKAYHDSAVFLKQGGKHMERLDQGKSDERAEDEHTDKVVEGLRREQSTPSEGILTSTSNDRDAATS